MPALLGTLALLLLASWLSVATLLDRVQELSVAGAGMDPASRAEARYARVQAVLKPDEIVGYTTEPVGEGLVAQPGFLVVIDRYVPAIASYLRTGTLPPGGGIDERALRIVEDYRGLLVDAAGAPDPVRIRAALVEQLDALQANLRFTQARYALAPHLLIRETGAPRILGDYLRPDFDYEAWAKGRGLVVEEALGEGLVLFRVGRRR